MPPPWPTPRLTLLLLARWVYAPLRLAECVPLDETRFTCARLPLKGPAKRPSSCPRFSPPPLPSSTPTSTPLSSSCRLVELKRFYNVTSGADWTINTNWDLDATSQCGWADNSIPPGWPYNAPEQQQSTGPGCIYKDPCTWDTKWHGVGCVDPCYAPTDGDNCVFGRVTMVSLRQNSLAGTIPESFFNELINITVFDVAYNYISGSVPTEVGKMRNLRSLDMQSNVFSGTIPTEIAHLGSAYGLGYGDGGLEGLTTFDMSHNNLTGTIPSEVGYLENLENFDVSRNPNFGTPPGDGANLALNPGLPTQIGLLTHLVALKFDGSGFMGTVPTQVRGHDRQMRHAAVLRKRTAGPLFASCLTPLSPATASLTQRTLCPHMQCLVCLACSRCPFPLAWFAQVGELTRLEHLLLRGTTLGLEAISNRFSGTIPTQVGKLSRVMNVALNDNRISGTIPPQVRRATHTLNHGDRI
jgi:hypothetical protein